MSRNLRIVMAQLNLLVGDIDGNADKIVDASLRARDDLGAQAVVFPELTITGYPPEDLLLRPGFLKAAEAAVRRVAEQVRGIDVILGYPQRAPEGVYNAAGVLRDGEIVASYFKSELPNYGVFDERRYFIADDEPCVVEINGVRVGLTLCEDIWFPGPAARAAEAGARLLLNLNASPFHIDKGREREAVLATRVREAGLPIVYVNLVGGQDELVFDGESLVMAADGNVCTRVPAFEEGLFSVDFSIAADGAIAPLPGAVAPLRTETESVYNALVLGVRDYVNKNGFPRAILGLSGGIDSALTLALAVDALGAARVEAVMMPSRYTHEMSLEDARAQAQKMGVEYHVQPIEAAFQAFLHTLKDEFAGLQPDITEENIQARCRGILLMAISNKKHGVVLTTGNKSEMAVGYATLYGDMAGGFDVLKDVPKTLVYRLADFRNGIGRNGIAPVIPQRVIDRPPSAELAPDQKDTDSLPPYDVLDGILEMYVERDACAEDIVAAGYDAKTVERVIAMVNRNEYKRRQSAPGVRITKRAFGRDRRYPITCGYLRGPRNR